MKRNKPNIKAHKSHMELEKIIEDMGDAMRNAYMPYIARTSECSHSDKHHFTPDMTMIWNRYVIYAMKQVNP